MKLSVQDFMDLTLFWLADGLDEKELMNLERQLTIPPVLAEVSADDPIWSADAEMDAFRGLMG